MILNGGDSLNANMISIDSLFPSNNNNTIAASMDIFPAAFYLDVSHDGIKDLIVTSNSENNSENFESSWFYTNNGTNTNPDFNYIQKNFLQENMIDLGAGSYPIFFDHNSDGLEDLIVGNYGYHQSGGNPSSKLALFTNTGTVLKPNYVLENRDWQNLSQINLNTNLNIPALNLTPTFGDLDDDSDQDMILGDANGKIHYFINNGFLEKEVFFSCKVLRLGKAQTHTRIRYEGKLPVDYLSLRELEFFTCARLPVFLSFYSSGISGEESCFLERCS